MQVSKGKCPKCGNLNYILPTNNPLVDGICNSCLNTKLDAGKVEDFAFFCRTYNIPFQPNLYMSLYKQYKGLVFTKYVESINIDAYTDQVTEIWPQVEREWSKVKTYSDIVLKLPEVRASFEERARVKWGHDYTFAELIQLENLFINTIKVHNITDPMRLDAIKKSCKISVKIDSMIESGDAKAIKEYTGAYKDFLKTAQIDELGQVANEGTIKTVADLYKYMEKNGFEFTFYDKEERDIVDKTLNDIKESIRYQISNATGIDLKLQEITKKHREKEETEATEEAVKENPLDKLIASEDYYEELELEADKEFEEEELDLEYDED